jgi:hypothetical protein
MHDLNLVIISVLPLARLALKSMRRTLPYPVVDFPGQTAPFFVNLTHPKASSYQILIKKEFMGNWFRQLKPYYEKAVVGENNNGFVEVRDTTGLDLKEQAQGKQFMVQENKDRTSLYRVSYLLTK